MCVYSHTVGDCCSYQSLSVVVNADHIMFQSSGDKHVAQFGGHMTQHEQAGLGLVTCGN